jgi:hypothetical protein
MGSRYDIHVDMGQLLRRTRGALGVALTWGVVWAALFLVLFTIIGLVHPQSVSEPGETPMGFALIGAGYGFFSGVVFALLLAVAERGRSISDLPLWRVALWGAVAPAAWPLLTQVNDAQGLIFAPAGAALSAGLVALARRSRAPAEVSA